MSKGSISRELLTEFINEFGKEIESHNGVICGSYRRMVKTCGDLDILLVDSSIDGFINSLMNNQNTTYKFTKVRHGAKVAQYKVESGHAEHFVTFNMDIKVVSQSDLAFATLHYTGSQFLNIAMRSVAKKMGLKLCEYGFETIDESIAPVVQMKPDTERSIFSILGFNYIEPELRTCIDIPSAFALLNQFKK